MFVFVVHCVLVVKGYGCCGLTRVADCGDLCGYGWVRIGWLCTEAVGLRMEVLTLLWFVVVAFVLAAVMVRGSSGWLVYV